MCWLWAAVYILIIRQELDHQWHLVIESKGKLWDDAGKSKRFNIRLIDAEVGRLLVDNFSAASTKKYVRSHLWEPR